MTRTMSLTAQILVENVRRDLPLEGVTRSHVQAVALAYFRTAACDGATQSDKRRVLDEVCDYFGV